MAANRDDVTGDDEPGEDEVRPSPLDPGVLRAAGRRWDGTLDKTLRSAVIPYGYTVTIWATGAYLVGQRGLPSGLEAFIFVCGAIVAFSLLSTLAARRARDGGTATSEALPIHPDSTHPVFAAGVHIAAIGIAFLAAAGVDQLGDFAWFAGSFTVTLIYLGLSSLELALAIETHKRQIGLRRARVVVRRQRAHLRDVVRRR